MLEIEAKFLEIDVPLIVQQLDQAGAVEIYNGDLFSHKYDYPDGRLKATGESLRLRYFTTTGLIQETMKRKIHNDGEKRINKERESQSNGTYEDFLHHHQQLLDDGLVLKREIYEHRQTLATDIARYELNSVREPIVLPPFLEIEVEDPRLLEQAAAILGLSLDEASSLTTWKLIKHYRKLRKQQSIV